MNWYTAKIVYRITCGAGDHKAQFDEQLRLIGAPDADTAFQKAVAFGHTASDVFRNLRKEQVRWSFVNVTELRHLEELGDGTELHSRIWESEDPEMYTLVAHARAHFIIENIHPQPVKA